MTLFVTNVSGLQRVYSAYPSLAIIKFALILLAGNEALYGIETNH
jgi:hypothetical protein